jgi:eukaryotic-like serine/threonine-protein kinase
MRQPRDMSSSPDRWSTIERLYHAALAQPADARAAFLANVCAGDDTLRADVESLLAQEVGANSVLTHGAVAAAARMVSTVGPSVSIGSRLGTYEILASLGAGGMGEVYRARDTRLGRDVAIKILPLAFTSHPDRLARFEREARVLASLSHQHIGAIHGIEDSQGIHALVLELISGFRTLMAPACGS